MIDEQVRLEFQFMNFLVRFSASQSIRLHGIILYLQCDIPEKPVGASVHAFVRVILIVPSNLIVERKIEGKSRIADMATITGDLHRLSISMPKSPDTPPTQRRRTLSRSASHGFDANENEMREERDTDGEDEPTGEELVLREKFGFNSPRKASVSVSRIVEQQRSRDPDLDFLESCDDRSDREDSELREQMGVNSPRRRSSMLRDIDIGSESLASSDSSDIGEKVSRRLGFQDRESEDSASEGMLFCFAF